ncbi:MAG: hypothetical protein V5A45_06890 [Haloarculaceae archaeon]
MNRRQYVSLFATASIGALAGCPGSPEQSPSGQSPSGTTTQPATSTPSAEERTYETVVDLREEGADPTGEEAIDSLLSKHQGDDTKLVLPKGRYRVKRQVFADLDTFALVGDGATLVPTHRGPGSLFLFRRVSNVNVEGLQIDQTANGILGSFRVRCVGGENLIRNVTLDGHVDRPERIHGFTLFCEGSDTSLTLEDIDMTDGARNGTGVYVFPQDDFSDPSREPGELLFRNCRMSNWGGEGIYGSPHAGPISIVGGTYKNNAIQQVRVGGGNDNPALVKDVEIVVDDPPGYAAGNMRGIWLEEGDDCLVDSCTVRIRNMGGGGSDGGIVVGPQFGQAEIRNTTIQTDVKAPAINIARPATEFVPSSMPSLDQLPETWTVSCSNVQIHGASERGAAIHLYGREGCLFENVSMDQSSGSRHGLLTSEALSTDILGGNWVAAGYPMLFGPTESSSESKELVCFEDLSSVRSTEFDGSSLETTQPSDESAKTCIPMSSAPVRETSSRIPYIAITGTDEDTLYGHSVLANWDGSEVTQQD